MVSIKAKDFEQKMDKKIDLLLRTGALVKHPATNIDEEEVEEEEEVEGAENVENILIRRR
jgi:hypothetical protein